MQSDRLHPHVTGHRRRSGERNEQGDRLHPRVIGHRLRSVERCVQTDCLQGKCQASVFPRVGRAFHQPRSKFICVDWQSTRGGPTSRENPNSFGIWSRDDFGIVLARISRPRGGLKHYDLGIVASPNPKSDRWARLFDIEMRIYTNSKTEGSHESLSG